MFSARPPSLPAHARHPSVPLSHGTRARRAGTSRYSLAIFIRCKAPRGERGGILLGFEPPLKIARKFKADIQGEGTRKPAKLLTQPPAIAAILSACADSSADRAGAPGLLSARFPGAGSGADGSPSSPRSQIRACRGEQSPGTEPLAFRIRSAAMSPCWKAALDPTPVEPVCPSLVAEPGSPARILGADSLPAAC